MKKFSCVYIESCSGCSKEVFSFEQQSDRKIQRFKNNILQSFAVNDKDMILMFPVQGYHRHRGDFISFDNQIGLYSKDKSLIPIGSCSLLDPELNTFLGKIKNTTFAVKKGTVRIRKSADNRFGLWLDFSNLDIKRLLDEALLLQELLNQGIQIEIGQKGKKLKSNSGKLKLSDPEPDVWFKTLISNTETPLYSLISSFTQPSYELNILMQQEIQKFIDGQRFDHIIEYGSGVGNFSLFLSESSDYLFCIENDTRNLIALEKNIESYLAGKQVKIISSPKSYQEFLSIKSKTNNLVFVNPPRSGVGNLFDQDLNANHVIYVSCYLDSMLKDLQKLKKYGFSIGKTILFDQFPQSEHFETITYLVR